MGYNRIQITITATEDTAKDVPGDLPPRIRDIIQNAFAELFNDGIIDMTVTSWTGAAPRQDW